MASRKVFISYSHDSDAHRKRVLELSNRLRNDGINCDIDQYNPAPQQGWPRWMIQSIQQADYVLLACTETYRNRLELEEEQGKGLGVKWEGSLIFNILYRDETLNNKFIPIVFESKDKVHIPNILFGYDHYNVNEPRGYENLYRHIRGEIGSEKPLLGNVRYIRTIHSDSLPTVEGSLFGRKEELALLDTAWSNPQTHIIQFIAPGGTGKTKLLRFWLDQTDTIEALIAWSFYSQGSGEGKQVSSTPFFAHAFEVLNSYKTIFNTEEEKGEHLANLLRQRRCLLVLDGLEPLQYAGRGMRGEINDRAIRQLLKSIAGEYNSLCVITTRIAVHEISNRPNVILHNLQNLTPYDSVNLLKSYGVQGSRAELDRAAKEYGCHALALHLLGNALVTYLDGDIHKRDTIDELLDDYDSTARHAFKIMQAYQQWLKNTPELLLLYSLSLFDHPIEIQVLEVLWAAQIPYLTSDTPLKAWKVAIRDLKEKHRLLPTHAGQPDVLDCHPLIREFFGKQLQKHKPKVWQQAHEKLYCHYKALPKKELPDTLEEMQPLFSAVAHGCSAGLHMQTILEVLWPRIRRKKQAYVIKTLGAYSDYITALSHFFEELWSVPVNGLSEVWEMEILNWAGFSLRALGRLPEADAPMQGNIKLAIRLENWLEAALGSNNYCELKLVTGDIKASIESGRLGLTYVDRTNDDFQRTINRATFGNALHQAMAIDDAIRLFEEAELIQQKREPEYPRLYSLYGFRYCELLLDLNRISEVLERFEEFLKWRRPTDHLLRIASEHLVGGRAYLNMNNWTEAIYWLNIAVSDLRSAGHIWMLPFGVLSRASCFRNMQDYSAARLDLEEVFDISKQSKMRLHLSEYHLESAKLWLAEGMFDNARRNIKAATDLIESTGYIRLLSQLKELQKKVTE